MNVLFIWDGEYPWDIRVEKVCNALLSEGHVIHLVCRNENRRPAYELYRGLHIHRIAALPAGFGKLNSAFTFPAFFSPVWLSKLRQVLTERSCDLIIVRDLPMAPAALFLKRFRNVPVVLDMAECYPEMLRCAWEFEGFRLSNLFARNPRLADAIERYTLKRVSHTFVMIEESRDRLIKMGVPSERISIVSNTPDIKRFEPRSPVTTNDQFEVIYVGLLNPSRGVETLLRAAKHVASDMPMRVRIVGSGKHETYLKGLADTLGLAHRALFEGWVDNTRIPQLMANADVGIVPHFACGHWNATIPNKLFDYMAAGIPVVVSDAAPTARIVNATGCGLVYESRNPQQLASVIERLADAELRRRLGDAGRKAVESQFNWSRDRSVLQDVISRFRLGTA